MNSEGELPAIFVSLVNKTNRVTMLDRDRMKRKERRNDKDVSDEPLCQLPPVPRDRS